MCTLHSSTHSGWTPDGLWIGTWTPYGLHLQYNQSYIFHDHPPGVHLGNSTGNPVGIAPATCTRPVKYPYPQPQGFSRQNEPKNVEIGQEMREL